MDKQIIPTNLSQARILVVDDNPSTASTLARAISHIGPGLKVISATSGEMALEKVSDIAVDLVITDMMMPDMNGLELIEKLRLHPGGSPAYTILITAFDVPGLKESARRLKVNETLIKPIQPERICQIVGKALEGMTPSQSPKQIPEKQQSFKILVADDNPSNIALLCRYLQQEDFGLVTAANGVETLEKTRAEMPDLILLDINMPEKDGFQVLQEVRSDPAIEHIPVIILTAARLEQADMQFALNLGADDYVTKPFDRRELLARIRTKLRVKEAEDAIRRRNKELSILPEIGKDLSARLDLDELCDVVLHRTVENLGAMLGHIIILNSTEQLHKEYRISSHASPAFEAQLPNLEKLLEQFKETRQGLIINNIDDDLRWQLKPDDPTHSVVIVPMFGRLELIGLIVLAHEKAGYFNLEHQLLLQVIASQAAIAVENAQLYAGKAHEQHRLAAILHSVADAILMFDAYNRLVLVNPAGEKLFTDFGAKLGLPLGRGCGYDAFIDFLEQSCASGEPKTQEVVWPDQRVFAAQSTPIGETGCVVLLHDISHFKTLERVKNEFISAASHDLKSPLAAISGYSDLILTAGPLNETQLDYLNNILSAAGNMNELVQNLLDLAKADMGLELKLAPLDVTALVGEVLDEYKLQAESKKQSLLLDETHDQPVVEADSLQLRQALRNLVGNALKYTPEGGSIELSVESKKGKVVVSVKDTGYGIPTDELPFIFDRFYRVHNEATEGIEGSGLGLAIVKSIIEQHGGQVSVESKPGKGSCFAIHLPLAQQDAIAAHNSKK